MSLKSPLTQPAQATLKPLNETPAVYNIDTEDYFYDLFEDYIGSYQGQPDYYWSWDTWFDEFDYHVSTEWFQNKEDFYFYYEEINNNVPEASAISLVLLGCLTALIVKRRITK
jgi:hypothetical protein